MPAALAISSKERSRVAWSKTSDTTMSSSAPVSVTSASMPARTVSGRSNDGAGEHPRRLHLFCRRPVAFDVVDRRLAEAARAAEDVRKGHLLRRRQPARFVVARGGDDVDAHHRVGTVKLL